MAPAPACILMVEDHSDNRLLLTLLLCSEGYRMVEASSYAEGLSLDQETAFDLFLLDHWLGDDSGVDLREKLRQLHPATPALFCTATPYTATQIDKVRQSGDDYILKPSPTRELITSVAELLNTSTATREVTSLNRF